MISNFTNILWNVLDSCLGWLISLFDSVGLSLFSVLVGFAIVYSVVKYVLSPYLTGSGKSDKANKKKKGD